MDKKTTWQLICAFGATTLHFLFGGWTLPLQTLVAFVVLDYLCGVWAAFTRKELDSAIGAKGIAKKVGFFVLVAIAHLLDQMAGMGAPVLKTATIWFLLANEGLSILENLGEIGVPIPETLQDALRRLKREEKPGGIWDE